MKLPAFSGLLAIAVLLVGCATSGASSSRTSNRDLVTAADIANTTAHTAYEVVERLQPQWLTSRGNTSLTDASATIPSVFVNGIDVGDVEYLRGLLATDVAEMRYYGPGEAGARFGMGHPRGVIAVTLK